MLNVGSCFVLTKQITYVISTTVISEGHLQALFVLICPGKNNNELLSIYYWEYEIFKTLSSFKNTFLYYITLYAKRLSQGSVTCHGNMAKNVNCPKDQYMVVKTASYRGLSGTKTCGLSDDYSCEVDVTCLVKKQCDGQHECNITVNNNLFSDDLCPGLTKYLYFEYQCVTSQTFYSVCGTYVEIKLIITLLRFKKLYAIRFAYKHSFIQLLFTHRHHTAFFQRINVRQ